MHWAPTEKQIKKLLSKPDKYKLTFVSKLVGIIHYSLIFGLSKEVNTRRLHYLGQFYFRKKSEVVTHGKGYFLLRLMDKIDIDLTYLYEIMKVTGRKVRLYYHLHPAKNHVPCLFVYGKGYMMVLAIHEKRKENEPDTNLAKATIRVSKSMKAKEIWQIL